jgi:hypothetical protein
MVHVQFTYDEETAKWDVTVIGVVDETEAKQALNAVVLTCRDVIVSLEHQVKATVEGEVYAITPHVTLAGLLQSKTK